MSAVDALSIIQRQFSTSPSMNLEPEPTASHCITEGDGGDKGAELRQISPEGVTLSQPKQPTLFVGHNGEHKDYYVPVLPSIQSNNLSPDHHHSKRLLRRISEESAFETANGMTAFVDHADFRQGSPSSSKPRGPQYHGGGLGDVGFDEEDDDSELLLDEGLARDGLYRGISPVISFIHS
jgi:hypothetical protein